MRNVVLFNDNWKFAKRSELVSSIDAFEGEAVCLPHTWNAVDGQDGGNDYWRGTAMYAKSFLKKDIPLSEENNRVILSFKGAAMTSDVYLNGTKLCHHEGGYSTFRMDITEELKEENLLLVTVDNSENNRVYPQNADFTFYGGIYRNVELICVNEKHFELVKDGSNGLKVTPEVSIQGKKAEAVVTFEAWTKGGEEVVFQIKGMDETSALEVKAPVVDGYAKAELKISDAHLWMGTEDPYLYEVDACLMSDQEVCDQVSTRVGLRIISCDPEKGFILNGKVYPLRGVSRHQDCDKLGCALSYAEHQRDMELIKEIGANTIRLAHYQHADEFYDLCDQYGMVVWAEIPYITKHMPEGRQNTIDQMRELITQCYNHPSIVCWGLSNEITASGTVTEDLLENHRILNDMCHEMDKTRPTTMAHAFMLETDSELIPIADLASYNLYFGWYLGELEENDEFFDEYHSKFPERVIGFSEYGADANPGLHSSNPEKGDYSEEYQCTYHEYILNCIEKRPYLWATHVWNMFDFAADGRDEGGEHGKNQKGLITIDRQTKKDAFYLYKAYWNKEDAFVHLCGRRYVDRPEAETSVKVYSNCSHVALYVDGTFVAEKEGNRIFDFKVEITGKHTISVKAFGGVAGSDEVTDSIEVQKVEKANEAYAIAKNEGGVINWFDAEGIKDGFFSIKDTFGDLMANPEAGKIVGSLMQKMIESRGDVAKSTQGNAALQKMLAKMSFASLLKQAGDAVSPEQIHQLNAVLQQIPKAMPKVKLELGKESTLADIFAHEESKAVFDKCLPGIRQMTESKPSLLSFSIEKVAAFSQGKIPEAAVDAVDKALKALEIMVDPSEAKVSYDENYPLSKDCEEKAEPEEFSSIKPGQVMRDSEGKRIQAHAGQVHYVDGVYYWIGENKDRTDGNSSVWTWGIRAYKSVDLYNWEDMGLIIEPNFTDKESGLYPECHADRPHILQCPATGKYVCWIKQCSDEACFTILQAEKITGPYTLVTQGYRPEGLKVGDFDMITASDGKGYLYMANEQNGVVGYILSEDYLSVGERLADSYKNLSAPFCREGITLFERNGKVYMVSSGMSGYIPNKSEYAVASSFGQEFVSCGNPHVNDETNASFNSQISQIFKVHGKEDCYVAIADRWLPEHMLDAELSDLVVRMIASHSDPEHYQVTPEEQQRFMSIPMLEGANTSIANYVWLPISFDGDKMEIKWFDSWTF